MRDRQAIWRTGTVVGEVEIVAETWTRTSMRVMAVAGKEGEGEGGAIVVNGVF